MPIYDLYSRRQKRLNGEVPDVYEYDDIPRKMRMQIFYILSDIISNEVSGLSEDTYIEIDEIVKREHGIDSAYIDSDNIDEDEFKSYLLKLEKNILFDVIEVAFICIKDSMSIEIPNQVLNNYIIELNQRFIENSVGYQFIDPHIIRIDSQFIHSEVLKPALIFLHDKIYTNANTEFLKAHEHYRHNRYEEAIVEANKAFESVMKVIHSKRDWNLPSPANAKKLITSLMSTGLLPASMSNYFNNLNEILGGLPVLRNSHAGHGAGTEEREIPPYLASYALHLAATNIVFLIEAEKGMV